MNTDKRAIKQLAEICALKGMQHVVLSPGSRCAPLTIAFLRQQGIECLSIIDERSAAFVALGIAQQTRKPVGLVCTSGSAVLNYGPALAEAYYQKIPLVVFSADRPNEWIDQGENQSIQQYKVFDNYIKKSFQIPADSDDQNDLWFSNRLVNEAINTACMPYPGPVHVNIPLREPLYNLKEYEHDSPPKIIEPVFPPRILSESQMQRLSSEWTSAKKKLIIAGSGPHSQELNTILKELSQDPSVIILTETTSNLEGEHFIPCIDRPIEVITRHGLKDFVPDLLVSFGGGVVSKKLKFLFRTQQPGIHWHLSDSQTHWDTFQSLTQLIDAEPLGFFKPLKDSRSESDYRDSWLELDSFLKKETNNYLNQQAFTDFTVFRQLHESLPQGCNVHYGNSTPVRYSNLFGTPINKGITVNANRGVSGIDGVLSTAAGAAFANDKLTICITGDLSFFYDSNALWNKQLPGNLRYIIINNGGGNIFRIIPGPDRLPEVEQYFETRQDISAEHIARAFGVPYYHSATADSLGETLPGFYGPQPEGKAAILEIQTPGAESAAVLRNYLNHISNKYEQEKLATH